MARRFDCPLPKYPDGWIEIPDEWLGRHANQRDDILASIPEGTKQTAVNWMVATKMLDNWGGIAPMTGNPDKWDFADIDLNLIGWITITVNGDYNRCFEIKKKSSKA